MSAVKKQRVLPAALLGVAAIVVGWWWQHPAVSEQDRHYYASLLCVVAGQTPQVSQFSDHMRAIVENGNSDYALKKMTFNPAAASGAIQRWQQLTADQQQQASKDPERCRSLVTAAAR